MVIGIIESVLDLLEDDIFEEEEEEPSSLLGGIRRQ
jgi:hypothetical protein